MCATKTSPPTTNTSTDKPMEQRRKDRDILSDQMTLLIQRTEFLSDQLRRLCDTMEATRDDITRLQALVDRHLSLLHSTISPAPGTAAPPAPSDIVPSTQKSDIASLLCRFTTKQHAALQMVLRGASNRDIGLRFGITTNTAKVHVRSIAAKLAVKSRSEIHNRMLPILTEVDPEAYREYSGGLPLWWIDRHPDVASDPYAQLYRFDPHTEDAD